MQIDRYKHEEIKFQLRTSGSSFSKLARQLNLSHTSVLSVSIGRSRSIKIELAIASAIGKAPEDIWPDRYKSN